MIPPKNSQHQIKIEDVTAMGFGVGNINGFTIFADGGLPGDEVRVQILKTKPRYAYGKIIEILNYSPLRISSPCPASGKCGGCQFQHCAYPAQLEIKKRLVTGALERIGGVESPNVPDVLGMEKPMGYRNKATFPIAPAGDGFAIGMYAARSHRITEVEHCIIQHPAHVKVLEVMRRHIKAHKISAYNETTHTGLMRHIMIRTSLATREVMVVLVINGDNIPGEQELCEGLTQIGATTVVANINNSRGNTILGSRCNVLCGTGFIRERLGHVEYQLSAPSFFQVNPVQAKVLYDIALNHARLTGSETIIDAHAGVGGIALYVASRAKKVIGMDISQSAITDAQKNAALNGIENATFICGTAEDVIPGLLSAHDSQSPPVIFLDPPRKGCEPELLNAIVASAVEKIVYISCDPATLARDVKILATGGYRLAVAQPVDMFPMTGKVEVAALLQRG